MLRHSLAVLVALVVAAGSAWAADKEVTGKVVKVDATKKIIIVKTATGNKEYTISDDTKFLGPKGGASDKGIKDDRLVAGAQVKLVIAGNNKTVREVHLPERKGK
jgi:hypothetical protein